MDFERIKTYFLNKLERSLAPNLYYHGVHHIIDVLRAAEILAENEAVYGKDKILLLTAALFHDGGYLVRYPNNEEISVGLCWTILPKFGYKNQDIQYIVKIIEATTMPQKPFDKLSAILCDADLDYLGRDDYFQISCNLRKEWKAYGKNVEDHEWYEIQINFLSKHTYYTTSAKVLRQAKKEENLAKIKKTFVKTFLEKTL
jgi:HD superfamily phosphodiesterase